MNLGRIPASSKRFELPLLILSHEMNQKASSIEVRHNGPIESTGEERRLHFGTAQKLLPRSLNLIAIHACMRKSA